MLIRRCAILIIEPEERIALDLARLFSGDAAVSASMRWLARAAHLDQPVPVDDTAIALMGAVGESLWIERSELEARHAPPLIKDLLDHGLLIADGDAYQSMRERDQRVRDQHWFPLAALYHQASLWNAQTSAQDIKDSRFPDLKSMIAALGPPPAETPGAPATNSIALARPPASPLETLMRQRLTCRNFDSAAVLPQDALASLLARVFAAQGSRELAEGAVALKKTSPSGGSLHPIECYALVQRTEGIASGLYHYHTRAHALSPIALLQANEAATLAMTVLADQDWFANAAVLLILVSRLRRGFWKYRNHPKAFRAQILDAGHLSQSHYLCATELGLGAFVTAAINEIEILEALQLDSLEHAPLAILGVGHRADQRPNTEFETAPIT